MGNKSRKRRKKKFGKAKWKRIKKWMSKSLSIFGQAKFECNRRRCCSANVWPTVGRVVVWKCLFSDGNSSRRNVRCTKCECKKWVRVGFEASNWRKCKDNSKSVNEWPEPKRIERDGWVEAPYVPMSRGKRPSSLERWLRGHLDTSGRACDRRYGRAGK